MRIIKNGLGIALLAAVTFTSCLKSKNDFAGLRTDKGTIVTSIAEKQYINTDAQNIGFGYTNSYANFSFTAPATESVRFFTLHISQPRETKLSGSLQIKVAMSALTGFTMPPANAITVPTEISVPASSQASFDVPVRFSVNKAGFNATTAYGATFTITSVSQGIFSELDKSIDVVFNYAPAFNTSRYTARYIWTSSVVDPAKQIGITNNTKPVILEENVANSLDINDWYAVTLGGNTNPNKAYVYANNLTTGASTAIFGPRYVLDATGKVTSIVNQYATATVTNITLDATGTNQFTYTSNDARTFTVKYSFTYTTVINGLSTARVVTVTDSYTYDPVQVFY